MVSWILITSYMCASCKLMTRHQFRRGYHLCHLLMTSEPVEYRVLHYRPRDDDPELIALTRYLALGVMIDLT